eukprot:s488_g17.t1
MKSFCWLSDRTCLSLAQRAKTLPLRIFMDGLPLDVSLCRLVWFGTLWGCTIEAVVMAAACSSKDPFNSPSRIFAESDEAYLAGLRLSWMARRRFDGGHFSEPIMMLRLFAYWAMHFGKLAQLKGKARFDTALGIVSKNANIHPGRPFSGTQQIIYSEVNGFNGVFL